MALKDDIKNYYEKYKDIPNDFVKRLKLLIDSLSFSDKEMMQIKDKIHLAKFNKWKTLNLVIFLVPKACPRPRFSKKTKRFYVFDAMDNSKLFKEFIDSLNENLGIIATSTKINIDAYMPIPNDMSRQDKVLAELKIIRPISAPDYDNITKTYCDMIQKHLLLNDSLVIEGRTRKFYSTKPRVELNISYLEKHDSKYNKRKVESWKYFKELKNKPNIESIF